jgi:GGDEF domain-containing protein
MDPLTATATVVVMVLAGAASVAWHLGRRIRRAEAHATRLRRQLQVEYHAANHDPLTGLPNRRGLFRLGESLMAQAAWTPLVAVVVDLDDFKQANDRFGHATGDQVLVTIATRLAGWAARQPRPGHPATRARHGRHGRGDAADTGRQAVVARLGGDEFAGLLTAPTADPGWLRDAAWRLTEALSAPVRTGDRHVSVTASVGIVPVPAGVSLTEALYRADTAMYRTKAGGRTPYPATAA